MHYLTNKDPNDPLNTKDNLEALVQLLNKEISLKEFESITNIKFAEKSSLPNLQQKENMLILDAEEDNDSTRAYRSS